jgi:hypothetical protein
MGAKNPQPFYERRLYLVTLKELWYLLLRQFWTVFLREWGSEMDCGKNRNGISADFTVSDEWLSQTSEGMFPFP